MTRGRLFVNGSWLEGRGEAFVSSDPFSGEQIWEGRAASVADVQAALGAASAAFASWSNLSCDERYAALERFAASVKERRSALIEAVAHDAGKPLWEAATEIDALVSKLAPTKAAQELRNATRRSEVGPADSVTRFRPHGAVVVLGPFNFPASMANSHMMPALLAGNTVVVKPSEQTPLVAQRVFECWEEASLPNGVVNLVQGGADVGQTLVEHEGAKGVFLTGSLRAGRAIQQVASRRREEPILALEMGGNSPLVVWDYHSVESAVFIALQSAFISAGQRCSSARRLIVQRSDTALIDALVRAAQAIVVGDPVAEEQPYFGPLISSMAAERVLAEQERLAGLGAEALVEMTLCPSTGGALVSPGIIDVTDIEDAGDDEVFGPLLKLYRVDSFEEATTRADSTQFGLAAGLVSKDRARFETFLRQVSAGIINWNQQLTGAVGVAPFGGVRNSGNHRPGGFLAADYCAYASASLEVEKPEVPEKVPPGLLLR